MRILHPGIFPVDQVGLLVREQEIIRNGIDVRQHSLPAMALNIGAQRKYPSFGLFIVRIGRRFSVPKGFVEIDLFKDVKRMVNL